VSLEDDAQITQAIVVLTFRSRVTSAVIGAIGLGLGTASIFVKNNNGGSIALIAIGGLFLLMAVTGHGIRSVKVGSNELVMDTVAEAQRLKSQGDEEGAEETIETLIETIDTATVSATPTVRTSRAESYREPRSLKMTPQAYESEVRIAVDQSLGIRGMSVTDMRPGARRFDFVVQVDGLTIAAEVRHGPRIRPVAFIDSMNGLLKTTELNISGLLVVINTDQSDPTLERLNDELRRSMEIPSLAWPWQPHDGTHRIGNGIEQLLIAIGNRGSGEPPYSR
jgi:hypothetical protein